MSRFGRVRRVRRRPDHWDSTARARATPDRRADGRRAAPRGERAWLDEHLAGCAACTSLAAEYAADRDALRAMRDTPPEPPRDLWARTASAIERESGRHRSPQAASGRGSRLPVGALSGIAVILVVIGVSTVSSGIIFPSRTACPRSRATRARRPEATPAAVRASRSRHPSPSARVRCSGSTRPQAAGSPTTTHRSMRSVRQARRRAARRSRTTASRTSPSKSTPRTIIESPRDGQDVVISDNGASGAEIIVFDLPRGVASADARPGGHGSADAVAVDRADGHRHGDARVRPAAPRRHRKPRRRRRRPRRRLPRPPTSSANPATVGHAGPADTVPVTGLSPITRRSPMPSPSPATSSSSVNRRPSRRTVRGSRSPPGPKTDRAARTSTSGRSATMRPARSRQMGRPSSPRGTATPSWGAGRRRSRPRRRARSP